MDGPVTNNFPKKFVQIVRETTSMGFNMASDPKTGALLRVLATTKQNGRFLELGTGTGLSAAWILSGMDSNSTLVSIDNNPQAQKVAKKYLSADDRIEFICQEGIQWLEENQAKRFEFIFADALPGKFENLNLALNLLTKGGLYIVDDLLPQENWPEGHAPKIPQLISEVESKSKLKSIRISWATGLMIVANGE